MADRLVETHCSTLFFVDDRVYKRKKPLDLGFVDFRRRSSRRDACRAEVRLNRRLAPDVYLGTASVEDVGRKGCETLVVMRRLPDERRLARVAASGEDVTRDLVQVAEQLASLHQRFPAPRRHTTGSTAAGLEELWERGLGELRPFEHWVDADTQRRTAELARRYLRGRPELFDAREAAGRVVDGHGDLLADDVFLLPDGPRLLDCLDFDAGLRMGDGLLDAAFLAMDLERLARDDLARLFLDAYRAAAREDAPVSLEHHYLAYRAHVRCKVACLRAGQTGDHDDVEQARLLARLALGHLEQGRVRLVMVGGLPGSGKTILAAALAERLGAVTLSSDEVRKRLHGLQSTTAAPAPYRAGIYTPESSEHTYSELVREASSLLRAGRSVVLDATFTRARHRTLVRRMAEACLADLSEVRCVVPEGVARARLAQPRCGASDADPAIRVAMARDAEPWSEAQVCDTSSSGPIVLEQELRSGGVLLLASVRS